MSKFRLQRATMHGSGASGLRVSTYRPPSSTRTKRGTISDGVGNEMHELCGLPDLACYTMTVSAGDFPDEISWQIIIEGMVRAEGW